MRNVWTFARREYKHYFISPIAYVAAIVALLTIGVIFVYYLSYASNQSLYTGSFVPDTGNVLSPLSIVFLITIPVLTMRLLADERRMGTMELLLTAPVRDWELVVGKWLGSFLFTLTIIAATLIFPIVLNRLVTPGIDQTLMLACYLAVILLAAAYLAIGTAISAIFSNQFAAFFVTLIILMVLWWLIQLPANMTNVTSISNFFNYLDLNNRFNEMLAGKVTLSDIVYPLSLTGLGLFLGSVVVEMRRWQ
jgi:ABC-2 type transport system permease protein